MITIEQMVQREVLCCMSSLVSTLAQGGDVGCARNAIEALCDQACELAAPVLDYEEAALQEGWKADGSTGNTNWFHAAWFATAAEALKDSQEQGPTDFNSLYVTAEAVCNCESIDPYEWEVYEHWAVSQRFADKLIKQGERVDTDFGGLCIWSRTTTGQAISMDGCIQRIYKAMTAPLDSVAPGA